MAFAPAPSSWISTWSEDATSVSFDLATLTETLTAAEADATTGDWRDCLWSLLEHTWQYYNGLATADEPTKVNITKHASLNTTTNEMLHTFQFQFYTDIASQDVADES